MTARNTIEEPGVEMVKIIHGICALLLLSVLAGQACKQAAKPQEAAKLEAAKPQNAAKPQTTKPAKITLIEAGELFYVDTPDGDEIMDKMVKNDEKWLGLYVTEGGSSLIESKVTVKPLFDAEFKDRVLGKIIGVDQPGKPIFLVKGAAMLKPGAATTIHQGGEAKEHELVNTEDLASRKLRQLNLGDQAYQLKVVERKVGPHKPLCDECVSIDLALVCGEQTQILTPEGEFLLETLSYIWKLLWAGDVDGDGKLDLYVRFDLKGLHARRELFLSSQAKPGQLVKSVVSFESGAP
jgi:hypothetical protein